MPWIHDNQYIIKMTKMRQSSNGPVFSLQTDDPAELLRVLTVDMMFHHLQVSNEFTQSHLWSWVDRSQIYSIDYLEKSYENILNTWTLFKSTGHGAIELGRIVNIPEYLFYINLGLESRRLSKNEVFLKMNVDEYLALVAIVTHKDREKVMNDFHHPTFPMAKIPCSIETETDTEADFFGSNSTKPVYDPFEACMTSAGLSPSTLQLHGPLTYSSKLPKSTGTINTRRSGTGWLKMKKPVLRFW